jgi:hypothetical protein
MPITHNKVSLVANSGDPSLVQPSDWNAAHSISGVLDLTGATSVLGVTTPFPGIPSGTCQSTQLAVNTLNGNLYSCNTGSWQLIISSGGGTGIVASLNLVGQTTSIATTTLYPVPGLFSGVYVIYMDILVTTPGVTGTVTANVSWSNGLTTTGLNSPTFPLNASAEQPAISGNFYSIGSQNITYSTSVVGATGGPQYALRLRLQYLG